MRRSGAPTVFHGAMRPTGVSASRSSTPASPQRASLSQPGTVPLSQLTPVKFDIPAGNMQPPAIGSHPSQVFPPASVSSEGSSLPSTLFSAAKFQVCNEVRQAPSGAAPGASASTNKPPVPLAPDPGVARQKVTPQFRTARKDAPGPDGEKETKFGSTIHVITKPPGQPQNFNDRLPRAQEQSQVWKYIEDKLEVTNFSCKGNRERDVMLEILKLPGRNHLDEVPVRNMDRSNRRYNVIMGSFLQVVGIKRHCGICSCHSQKNWEHKKKTCVGLLPEATSPKHRELIGFVAGRCSKCIRRNRSSSWCHFAAGDEVSRDTMAKKSSRVRAAVNLTSPPGDASTSSSQNREPCHEPKNPGPTPSNPSASSFRARAPGTGPKGTGGEHLHRQHRQRRQRPRGGHRP
jgi:hypothetical protein